MDNLRSLTVDQVREYHAKYYRCDNLCVSVTGQVDPRSLLLALGPTLRSVAAERQLNPTYMKEPFEAPFNEAIPPLPTLDIDTQYPRVEFPSEEDARGAARVCWLGPEWGDFVETAAVDALLVYLTEGPLAPLGRVLVDGIPSYCGAAYAETEYLRRLYMWVEIRCFSPRRWKCHVRAGGSFGLKTAEGGR